MIIDALGRQVSLTVPPQRIISLVPSLTEYLFAVGKGDCVVGVTDFCVKPADQVAHVPKVRGTKNPNRALIRELKPDLVLAAKEENRAPDIYALEAADIPIYVTDIRSVADTITQLTALAHILAINTTEIPFLQELHQTLSLLQNSVYAQSKRRCLTFIWRDPWMAVGSDTYADDVLRLCGADNVATKLQGRYPRAELQTFLALEPDLILLPSEPYPFTTADFAAFDSFYDPSAIRSGQIHLCDGELLTWYGPQTITALQTFSSLLTK